MRDFHSEIDRANYVQRDPQRSDEFLVFLLGILTGAVLMAAFISVVQMLCEGVAS